MSPCTIDKTTTCAQDIASDAATAVVLASITVDTLQPLGVITSTARRGRERLIGLGT